jgi:hypothetical protein
MKYTLKAQSVVILRGVLTLPGWAKSIEQIYIGGKILAVTLPRVPNGTAYDVPYTFEMDGPDRDTCKLAFEHALSKDAIPTSEYVVDLLETMQFVSKPKDSASASG